MIKSKSTNKKRIYLDYASATPVLPEALEAMREAYAFVGNPSAIHREGVEARRVLDEARAAIASELACKPREIVFTSGGTETNNLAILGFANAMQLHSDLRQAHWIVGAIEHPSVLECFGEVERQGGEVTFIQPNERGIISIEAVRRALRPATVFVSIGWANSEIGTIQPIAKIAQAIHAFNPKIIFHSDAGQAPLYLCAQVHTLGVDLLTLDSGKLYGPRGVGALFIGKRAELAPILHGGGQERGLRPGSENIALASGFAAALASVARMRGRESIRLASLRDHLARELAVHVPGTVINGDLAHALPHILNVSIPRIASGEYVALTLDHAGFAVSSKSACREGEARSHVVETLGGEPWRAANTLRFSLGVSTTQAMLDSKLWSTILACVYGKP